MTPIIATLNFALSLYWIVVLAYCIVQWLTYFRILNTNEPVVVQISNFLAKLVEPVLSKIRKYVAPVNGIDLSPIILLIILYFIKYSLMYYF